MGRIVKVIFEKIVVLGDGTKNPVEQHDTQAILIETTPREKLQPQIWTPFYVSLVMVKVIIYAR